MPTPEPAIRQVGRYQLYRELASGGMATVHLGRMTGEAGFSRVVAIKRMRPEVARQAEFVTMFRDEAAIAARVLHTNVVTTLDVVSDGDELLIVMEYVRGLALKQLMELCFDSEQKIPVDIALSVIGGALEGLHAAHNVRGEHGEPLHLIHRDVSPHNILVGRDGVPKIVDFGVAKAASRAHQTAANEVKGKLTYMAPERITRGEIDQRVDIFSMGVVLWEVLAGRKRYEGASVEEIASKLLTTDAPPLGPERGDVSAALDAVIRRATARSPADRYPTAEAMLTELEQSGEFASKRAVAAWVEDVGHGPLAEHEELTRALRAETAGDALAEEDGPTLLDNAASRASRDEETDVGSRTRPLVRPGSTPAAGLRHGAVSTIPMRAMARDDDGPESVPETRVMTTALARTERHGRRVEVTQTGSYDEPTRPFGASRRAVAPPKPVTIALTLAVTLVLVIAGTVAALRACAP